MPTGGWESATVRIEPTGKITVLTGASPHGQGQETTFSQIVADELGVTMDDIVVIHGDTARIPYGIGTFGSRGTAVGGTAVYLALQDLKDKMKKFAAMMLETTPDKIAYESGRMIATPSQGQSVGFMDVVGAAYAARRLPPGVEPGLEATRFFEPSNFTFPFGTHVCVVEIDGETGEPKITKYVAVDDCGNVINPMLVEGQVHGGIVQGIGQALLEHAIYDEDSGQLLAGSFMDYAMPRAGDIPDLAFSTHNVPSTSNPFGVKGAGEAGSVGAPPAVINAIVDALHHRAGVRHIDMPATPRRVWETLNGGH